MNNPKRRKSIRLEGFDYTAEGAYFVTIVTHKRKCLFGNIINDEMVLSEYGKIVADEWERSAALRDEIELGEYVVMPNHFHGIAHIFQNGVVAGTNGHTDIIGRGDRPQHDFKVGAYSHTPLQKSDRFRSPSHSLGAMVRGFKSAVTSRINVMRGTGGKELWQRNYYDHIIRNDKEYALIEGYIQDNPIHWATDEENENPII